MRGDWSRCGAGEMVMPVESADGEKQIDRDEFGKTVKRVLDEPGYRAAARRVAASMAQFGGAQEAAVGSRDWQLVDEGIRGPNDFIRFRRLY